MFSSWSGDLTGSVNPTTLVMDSNKSITANFEALPKDTTAPTVSITSPSSGSTVSGTVTLSANASDNVGVVGVQFKLDGQKLGVENTASPYSYIWSTIQSLNGSHTLTATARDAAGNQTTSSGITINVNNIIDPKAPVASYSFNEGSGTSVIDSSIYGNTGTWLMDRVGCKVNTAAAYLLTVWMIV